LWTEHFDREAREASLIPGDIASALSAHLEIALTPDEEARLAKPRPIDPSLYSAYANGRHHFEKWTAGGVEKAIRCFQEAIDVDATYAPAWAALGQAYLSWEAPGPEGEATDPEEYRRRRAEAALLKALELDPSLREPHQAMGMLKLEAWDWRGAAREFQLAHEADPSYPGFPVYLLAIGSFPEAVEVQSRLAAMDPLGYSAQLSLGWTAFMAGQFDVAVRALKATIELDPDIAHAHRELAWAYAVKGMHEEAARECEIARELVRRERSNAVAPGGCEWVAALAGQRAEALDMARAIERDPRGGGHRFVRLAHVHDALGDRERALAYLRQAYDVRAATLPRSWYVPMLSVGIKTDRRFQDLIRRTGDPWARFPSVRAASILGRLYDGLRR
jgi:tetratricopeptide (TPR) repeat protein